MTIIPNHNLANVTPQQSYGSLLCVVPAPNQVPNNLGIQEGVTFSRIGSGSGRNTKLSIAENGLKFDNGAVLIGEDTLQQGFVIPGEINTIMVRTDIPEVGSLQPGELALNGTTLYFLHEENILSVDLIAALGSTAAVIEINPANQRIMADIGEVDLLPLAHETIVAATAPDVDLFPQGALWLSTATSPYTLHYLDKSDGSAWIAVTGEDVTAHIGVYGPGGHIPIGGITDSDVASLSMASISDLDSSTFVFTPEVNGVTPPLIADTSRPWYKNGQIYWYDGNEFYRGGNLLDVGVTLIGDGTTVPLLSLSREDPDVGYNIRTVTLTYDVETPNGDTTLLNGTNRWEVSITDGTTPLHQLNVEDDSIFQVEDSPTDDPIFPVLDGVHALFATLTKVGSPPELSYAHIQITYERVI